MLVLLRCWVGLVAVMALVNGVQCFIDQQFPKNRIYDLQPSEVTRFLSRTFGVWSILASIIRFAFVVSPRNHSVFAATLASFVLVFFHFTTEVYFFHTASPTFATITPIFVSGITVLWMTFVWPTLSLTKNSKQKNF